MNTPDIVNTPSDREKVFGTDFTLDDWADIAKTLELNDGDDYSGLLVGKKRAYMIWLWLNTAYQQSFEQVQNGGSYQSGVNSKLQAKAFQDVMTNMQLEFPMLTIAQQIASQFEA